MTALAASDKSHSQFEEEWTPRIVVVDDDRLVVSMLQDLLVQEGYDVTCFTSSVAARDHLRREAADIVITDIKMPEFTGLDLLREIHERAPRTLVIVITGYSTLQSTLESVALGAFDYLTKPFQLGEVKLVVRRGIEQLRLTRENQRLRTQVSHLEHEFDRLKTQLKALTKEFQSLSQAQEKGTGTGPPRMVVPPTPQEVLRPYAEAAQTGQSRYAQRLELLKELQRRGVLSEKDFKTAKRKLAESTGVGGDDQ